MTTFESPLCMERTLHSSAKAGDTLRGVRAVQTMFGSATIAATLLGVFVVGCTDGATPDAANSDGGSESGLDATGDATTESELDRPGLSERYADYFAIGAAVDSRSYVSHQELLLQQFSSVTLENEMKPESLQRVEGTFNYAVADRMVDFARDQGMAVRGHTLVWHRQTPAWMFVDDAGLPATPEVLRERMQAHITNVVDHFKGRVDAWDVVNEAMNDDGTFRTGAEEREDQQSRWHEILGESYIADAFRFAHEADPDARLFYNDYYNYLPEKQQGIYDLLASLLADGVPVHGVGLQGHINIEPSPDPEHQSYHQTVENLEAAIELYESLGLEIHVTELDMSIYIGGTMYEEEDFYTIESFTEEMQLQQAERYRSFFDLFRRHRDSLTSVTFWGLADDDTWLSEFSSGRTDFPLLFDTDRLPKKAFDAVIDF